MYRRKSECYSLIKYEYCVRGDQGSLSGFLTVAQGAKPFTISTMFGRYFLRLSVIVAVLGIAFSTFTVGAQQEKADRSRKFKVPPPSSRVEVTIVRDINGRPIENAAVIFHPMQGERDKGVMELKTNEQGKAIIDVLPIGDTVRLQIIAKGFQTYGQDFKVDKPEISIGVRMKRPGEQYSIYKNNEKAPEPPKEAPKDKPSTPAGQPASHPQ